MKKGPTVSTANLPGAAFSYKRWPHQGDGCKAHISSPLRNMKTSKSTFSTGCNARLTRFSKMSYSPIVYNENKARKDTQQGYGQKQRDPLARLTYLMVSFLLIT